MSFDHHGYNRYIKDDGIVLTLLKRFEINQWILSIEVQCLAEARWGRHIWCRCGKLEDKLNRQFHAERRSTKSTARGLGERKNNLTGLTWRPQRHHPQRPGKRPGHLAVRSPLRLTPGRRKAVVWGRRHRRCCRRLLAFFFSCRLSVAGDGRDWRSSSRASVWLMRSHPSVTNTPGPIRGGLQQTRGPVINTQTRTRANWCKPAKQNASHHFVSESL